MNRPRKKDRHLPACMYFRHGRHWYAKAGVWTPLAKDLGTALREYAALVEAPRGGCAGLIEDAFAAMKKRTGDDKLSDNTIRQYAIAKKRLSKILAKFAPEQVLPKHAAAIKRELQATPNMCNRILSFARQVFDYGLEEQIVESNPFAGIKRHREAKRTRLIQWEEWHRIRAAAPRRLQLVMDGLYLTDQRIDDVLRIDERDALEAGIYFRQQKTGKELIVAWNDDLRRWWEECREARGGKVVHVAFEVKDKPRPIFRAKGKATRPGYRTVYEQWVKACEAAGVEDANLHDNRAFSATEAKRQGLDPQALLGHDSERNTRIYLRGREVDVVQGPRFKTA